MYYASSRGRCYFPTGQSKISYWMFAQLRLIPTVNIGVINAWFVARCKNGFIVRTMCVYCEMVWWNWYVKTCSRWFYTGEFCISNKSFYTKLDWKIENWTYAQWFTALRRTISGDLREEGDDCKECCGMPPHHHDWQSSYPFTHVNILYTSFHSLTSSLLRESPITECLACCIWNGWYHWLSF